jgi:hypothetical protein
MLTRDGEPLVLITGQVGSGTGYDVSDYRLVRRSDPHFVVRWAALASYLEAEPPEAGGREITVRSCLFIGPDPLLAYITVPDTTTWTKEFLDSASTTWEAPIRAFCSLGSTGTAARPAALSSKDPPHHTWSGDVANALPSKSFAGV